MNTWIDIFGLVLGYLKSRKVFELRLVAKNCTFVNYNYPKNMRLTCSLLVGLYENHSDFLLEQTRLHPRSFTLLWNGEKKHIEKISSLPLICRNIRKIIRPACVYGINDIPTAISDHLLEAEFNCVCEELSLSWPKLEKLALYNVRGLVTMGPMPNLKAFCFRCNESGVVAISDAPNLEILHVTSVTPQFPKGLSMYPRLRMLAFNREDAGILSTLPTSLTYLSAMEIDDNLESLQRLTNLRKLNIEVPYITSSFDASVILSMPKLYSLYVYCADTNFSCLSQCSQLEELGLACATFADISILPRNIKKLDISGTSVRDINCLKYFTQLQELKINGTRIEDISALAACPHLRELVGENTLVNNIDCLIACPKLRILKIGIKDSNISALRYNTELETLQLGLTRPTSLELLAHLPKLKYAYICSQDQWVNVHRR